MIRRALSNISAACAARFTVLVPDWLRGMFWRSPLARKARLLGVDHREKSVEIAWLSGKPKVASNSTNPCNIDLYVPKSFFLERTITAPVNARGKLKTMAELDLKHRTPIQPEDVFSILGEPRASSDKNLSVCQWVLKRSEVEEWRALLAKKSIRLRKIFLEDHEAPVADFSNHLSSNAKIWRWLNAMLAVGALAGLFAGALYPGWFALQQKNALELEISDLRSQALSLRREVEVLRQQDSERTEFVDMLLRRGSLVDTLRDLTVALPDEVWIESMSYNSERVAINGSSSASAADLVLSLGKKPGFGNPRLSGPVSKTAANAERFEITFDVEGG